MKPKILVVIPTYGQYEYAALAVRSAVENTHVLAAHVSVVDDATPGWPDWRRLSTVTDYQPIHDGLYRAFAPIADKTRITWHRFEENGGLTRSWNYGLQDAADRGFDYCCVTNSDVVFGPGWDRDVVAALDTFDLVGPVTNAPGTEQEQYVGRYSLLYRKGEDDPKLIAQVQGELHREQAGRVKAATLNGFCLIAKTATWWQNPFDSRHVFRPRNDVNSKGQPNPTPLMTLNEYELQRRWTAAGLKSAIALGSYVFHYRAVSRGDAYKKGDWVRKKEDEACASAS